MTYNKKRGNKVKIIEGLRNLLSNKHAEQKGGC